MSKLYDMLFMLFVGANIIAWVYIVANNVEHKELWKQKCREAGGITIQGVDDYVCINPGAIVEMN